jgi:hypothetical protein
MGNPAVPVTPLKQTLDLIVDIIDVPDEEAGVQWIFIWTNYV